MLLYICIHISYVSVHSELMTIQVSYATNVLLLSEYPVYNKEHYNLYLCKILYN